MESSDGGTPQSPELYSVLTKSKLAILEPSYLPNTNVKAPYVFVQDEAYLLLPFRLKPYGGRNLTFNQRLSRCRDTTECAFGILFSKWRLLSKCVATKIDLIDLIAKCVCVLYNTIIDKDGVEH